MHSQRLFGGVCSTFKSLISSEKIFKFYKSNIFNHFNQKKGEWQSFKNILFYMYFLWRLSFFFMLKSTHSQRNFQGVKQPFKGLIPSGNLFKFHKSHIFNLLNEIIREIKSFKNIVYHVLTLWQYKIKSTHSQRNFWQVFLEIKCEKMIVKHFNLAVV